MYFTQRWLTGCISYVVEPLPPDRWQYITGPITPLTAHPGVSSPTSCWSIHCGGLTGPPWLTQDQTCLHQATGTNLNHDETKTRKTYPTSVVTTPHPYEVIPLTRYSSYTHFKCMTAWMLRFVHNCRAKSTGPHKYMDLCLSLSWMLQRIYR